jgi:hypothetical protein
MTAAVAPTVDTYRLTAANGRHIRMATRVTFPDGEVVTFLERLGKRAAIAQAIEEVISRRGDFESIGRQAYRNGESAAPALNARVQAAIADLPVGAGAANIMRVFTRGYEAERAAECARILSED